MAASDNLPILNQDPALNTATPPDGAPEGSGFTPDHINLVLRQCLANERALADQSWDRKQFGIMSVATGGFNTIGCERMDNSGISTAPAAWTITKASVGGPNTTGGRLFFPLISAADAYAGFKSSGCYTNNPLLAFALVTPASVANLQIAIGFSSTASALMATEAEDSRCDAVNGMRGV